jgi:hypothetical protein
MAEQRVHQGGPNPAPPEWRVYKHAPQFYHSGTILCANIANRLLADTRDPELARTSQIDLVDMMEIPLIDNLAGQRRLLGNTDLLKGQTIFHELEPPHHP